MPAHALTSPNLQTPMNSTTTQLTFSSRSLSAHLLMLSSMALLVVGSLVASKAQAATIVYSNDFESYSLGTVPTPPFAGNTASFTIAEWLASSGNNALKATAGSQYVTDNTNTFSLASLTTETLTFAFTVYAGHNNNSQYYGLVDSSGDGFAFEWNLNNSVQDRIRLRMRSVDDFVPTANPSSATINIDGGDGGFSVGYFSAMNDNTAVQLQFVMDLDAERAWATVNGITTDFVGGFFYDMPTAMVSRIKASTQLWAASVLTNNQYSDNFVVSYVPEPSTWALLTASLTTLMIFRRRRA